MSGFDADWLALRAPFDWAARANAAPLATRFGEAMGPAPLVADLGGGTGNNVRFLAPRIAARWRLADNEPALLAMAKDQCRGIDVETVEADLAAGPWPSVLDRVDGVTASALLDLVSDAWLEGLVDALAARRLPVLVALSVAEPMAWTPSHPDDDVIAGVFWTDLRRDKGFGPALGTAAAPELADRLTAAGYGVETAATDWVIGPDGPEMLTAMVTGIARAATRHGVAAAETWRAARMAALARGELGLTLGHTDVLGLI